MGENVAVHDDVHLDDHGKLTIGDRVSVSDDAHLYTHVHDILDKTEVTSYHTIVEDHVRITYDSMVRTGVKIGENAAVGAKSKVQGDVPPPHRRRLARKERQTKARLGGRRRVPRRGRAKPP